MLFAFLTFNPANKEQEGMGLVDLLPFWPHGLCNQWVPLCGPCPAGTGTVEDTPGVRDGAIEAVSQSSMHMSITVQRCVKMDLFLSTLIQM